MPLLHPGDTFPGLTLSALTDPGRPWPSPVERATGRELRAPGRVMMIEAPENLIGRPMTTFHSVVVTSPRAGGTGSA